MWSSNYLSPDLLPSYVYAFGCFLYVFWRSGQVHLLRPLDWSVLVMGAVYGFGLPIVMGQARTDASVPHQNLLVPYEGIYMIHTLAAMLATAGAIIGWNLTMRWRSDGMKPAASSGLLGDVIKISSYSFAFWLMLLTSFVVTWLYVYDYGGMFGAFEYSRLIRSGLLDEAALSRFSFLSPFRDFSALAALGFLGILLSGVRTTAIATGFSLSFLLTMYQLSLNSGRMGFLLFFATILLALSFAARIRPYFMAVVFIFILPLLLYLIYLGSNYFGVKGDWSFSSFVTRELSFIFTSFFGQLVSGDYLYRLFSDVLTAPMYALPSRLHPDWLTGASDINTIVHYGLRKGEGGNTANVPVDLLTFGLMQFHLLGVSIYAVMFGALSALMFRIVRSIRYLGVFYVFFAYICVYISAYAVFYAYPEHIIDTNFAALVTLLMIVARRALRWSPGATIQGA